MITLAAIQARICGRYRIDPLAFTGPCRKREIARPRQVAMYIARQITPRSLEQIGRRFGGRDHSTVCHAIRTIGELRLTDPHLDAEVRALMRELQQ